MTTPAASMPLVPRGLVPGVLILLVGAVFLADSLGTVDAGSGWALWPVAVIVVGLAVVLQPTTGTRATGTVLLVAGVWLLFNQLGIWKYSFWRTWPLILILLGAWMLYRTREMRREAGGPAGYDERRTGAEHVAAFAFLSPIRHDTIGQQLRTGEMTALAGSCAFDFSNLERGADPIVVDACAIAGRVRITVPNSWVVHMRVLSLLGRASDIRADDSVAAHVGTGAVDAPMDLLVRGTAIVGAVDVVRTV